MERLDSLSGSIALAAAPVTHTLTAKGMPEGKAVDKFFLKFIMTLARGGAPIAHDPQAIASVLDRLIISHGRVNWSVRGDLVHLFETLQRLAIDSLNRRMTAADVTYTFYLPVDPSPVGPPFSRGNHFNTEELQNMVLNLSMLNPFDNANDITALSTQVELWANYRERIPEAQQKPWTSVFRQQDSFQGNNIVVNDMVPSILLALGDSPNNFDRCNIQSSGSRIAVNADMVDLDAKDYYYQPLTPDNNLVQPGNQFLRNVQTPLIDAGAPSALHYTKLYDARNNPEAELPIVAEFQTIVAPFGYAVKGYGL